MDWIVHILNPLLRTFSIFHLVGWFSLTVSLAYFFVFGGGFLKGLLPQVKSQCDGEVNITKQAVGWGALGLLIDGVFAIPMVSRFVRPFRFCFVALVQDCTQAYRCEHRIHV